MSDKGVMLRMALTNQEMENAIASMGLRFQAVRKSLELPQVKLAEILGISLRALQSYEAGNRAIPYEALLILQRQFNIDLHWLLVGSTSLELGYALQAPTTSSTESTRQRLSWLCRHMRQRFGDDFSPSILAEAIGEENPIRLESILVGQDAAPFTLLDAIAAHCKINAAWLKHGIGEPV